MQTNYNSDDPKVGRSMKSEDTFVDKMRRKAYLNGKGVNPSEEHQLTLMFPEIIGQRDDLRHIPNDYARSSIFTVGNRRQARRTLTHERLFHYNEHISIRYTGIELRAEDDELVWLQILKYGQSVPFGQPFEFSIKQLVEDCGWHKNGTYYDRARQCISRLKANEIMVMNDKAYGKSGALSMIQSYTTVNDSEGQAAYFRVWIDPNLIVLFAGNTFTNHRWAVYRKLSPLARRLADYIESHRHPYPLAIETFRDMCGSRNTNLASLRQKVKKACLEVQTVGIAKTVLLSKQGQICCSKN